MEIKSAEGASHIGGVIDICLTFHFALDIPTLTFKTITYFLLQAEHNTQTRNKKENKQLIWTFSGKVTYEGYVVCRYNRVRWFGKKISKSSGLLENGSGNSYKTPRLYGNILLWCLILPPSRPCRGKCKTIKTWCFTPKPSSNWIH